MPGERGAMNMTLVLPDGGEITWDGTRVVPVGDRGLPETVLYHRDGDEKRPGLTLQIDVIDGVPRVTKVTLDASNGGQIRAKEIKWGALDLDRSVSYWLTEVAYRRDHDGGHDWVKDLRPSAAERRAAAQEIERGRRPTRQRKATPQLLREVAKAYKAAPTPKHENVALALGMTPRNAQRYITKAREAGLLPPSGRSK